MEALAEHKKYVRGGVGGESCTKECYKFRNLVECQQNRKDGMPGTCKSALLRGPGGTQAGTQTNGARGCALESEGNGA